MELYCRKVANFFIGCFGSLCWELLRDLLLLWLYVSLAFESESVSQARNVELVRRLPYFKVCSSFINLHYFSMPFAFYSSNSLTSFYLYTLPVKFFNLLFFSFCISLYSFCRSNVNALQLYSFIYSIKALFFHGKLMADEFHVSKQYLSKLTTLFNHLNNEREKLTFLMAVNVKTRAQHYSFPNAWNTIALCAVLSHQSQIDVLNWGGKT